jgi:pyridoxamine 5'-phosphate oxidase
MNIQDIRKDYTQHELDEAALREDPIAQFSSWFEEALTAEVLEANACALATVDELGNPHNRIVLLKGVSKTGFQFFTNYTSDKANEIGRNPAVAMTFFWKELERQVRIEGRVSKMSEEDSKAYFSSRPHMSQLGAWVSNQSQIISSRLVLEQRLEELMQRYPEGTDVPYPAHWGGFELTPTKVEFWQGRPSRLHDRICYVQIDQRWHKQRLAP